MMVTVAGITGRLDGLDPLAASEVTVSVDTLRDSCRHGGRN